MIRGKGKGVRQPSSSKQQGFLGGDRGLLKVLNFNPEGLTVLLYKDPLTNHESFL